MKMYNYNIWHDCYIWLLIDEEVFCPKCNGKGAKIYASPIPQNKKLIRCCFCRGAGKVDWVSRIMHPKHKYTEKHVYRRNKFET